jgi:hypothetical protein
LRCPAGSSAEGEGEDSFSLDDFLVALASSPVEVRGASPGDLAAISSAGTSRWGSLRRAALTTAAATTRARASAIMITPNLIRSGTPLNTRYLPSYVEY